MFMYVLGARLYAVSVFTCNYVHAPKTTVEHGGPALSNLPLLYYDGTELVRTWVGLALWAVNVCMIYFINFFF